MRWVGHVARMRRVEAYKGFWWGNLRERFYLEDPGIDGKIFSKWDVWVQTGLSWIRLGTGGVHL